MEALLACGVPDLELDDLVLESAFLGKKGGPDCRSQSASALILDYKVLNLAYRALVGSLNSWKSFWTKRSTMDDLPTELYEQPAGKPTLAG